MLNGRLWKTHIDYRVQKTRGLYQDLIDVWTGIETPLTFLLVTIPYKQLRESIDAFKYDVRSFVHFRLLQAKTDGTSRDALWYKIGCWILKALAPSIQIFILSSAVLQEHASILFRIHRFQSRVGWVIGVTKYTVSVVTSYEIWANSIAGSYWSREQGQWHQVS